MFSAFDLHETASLEDIHDVVPIVVVVRAVGSRLKGELPQVALKAVLRPHENLLVDPLVSFAVYGVGFLF